MHEHLPVVSNCIIASSLNIGLVKKCSMEFSGSGGHRIFFLLIYCSSSDLIHTTRGLVFNFSLASDFYLLLKYAILAITEDVYITKCILFWKTPFLEERLFYPIAMYFPIQIQGFFQCMPTLLPNTQSSKTVTVNRSFMFPLSFPLRALPRQGKPRL